jgi:hypothetical protein
MVNLVPHVKQDMYSVDCCAFNLHETVSATERNEVRCLINVPMKRDGCVRVDIVVMRLWDTGTFRISIRIYLCFKYFKNRNIQLCETFF